jgi:hypothetical protein
VHIPNIFPLPVCLWATIPRANRGTEGAIEHLDLALKDHTDELEAGEFVVWRRATFRFLVGPAPSLMPQERGDILQKSPVKTSISLTDKSLLERVNPPDSSRQSLSGTHNGCPGTIRWRSLCHYCVVRSPGRSSAPRSKILCYWPE